MFKDDEDIDRIRYFYKALPSGDTTSAQGPVSRDQEPRVVITNTADATDSVTTEDEEESPGDVFFRLTLVDASSTAKPLRILLPALHKHTSGASKLTIGRDATKCDPAAVLRRDSTATSVFQVSRVHCEIQWDAHLGGWILHDKSSKGCFVNGLKIEACKLLRSGDLLAFGSPDSPFSYRFEKGSWSAERRSAEAAAALHEPAAPTAKGKKKSLKLNKRTGARGSKKANGQGTTASRGNAEVGPKADQGKNALPKLVLTFARKLRKQFACPACSTPRMVEPVYLACCGGAACRTCVKGALLLDAAESEASDTSTSERESRAAPAQIAASTANKEPGSHPCPACGEALNAMAANAPPIAFLETAMELFDSTFKFRVGK